MRLVIIGNGVAGVTMARFVSERNPSAQVVIYTDERYLYYPRPRLVDLLAGSLTADQLPMYPANWYEERRIQMALGQRIVHIDPEEHQVASADGSVHRYDALVLATGAHSFVPPLPGVEVGVYTLRTLQDALSLLERTATAKRVVVLGGGLLGLDISAALNARNIVVTIVEMLSRLLPRQLDVEGAGVLQGILEDKGLRILTGDSCVQIEANGPARRLHLKSGQVLDADLVLVSAGVRPNIELAQQAGLACNRGVLVNERLLTSDSSIYAIGDVAEFNQRVWGIIPAALAQARVAAAQIAGDESLLYQDIIPSTTLQVTGIDLTSIGEVNPQGDGFVEVRRAEPTAGIYKKLVIRDGRVVGAVVLGDKASVRAINQLISRQTDVSAYADRLLSDGFDLAKAAQSQDLAARA